MKSVAWIGKRIDVSIQLDCQTPILFDHRWPRQDDGAAERSLCLNLASQSSWL